MSIIQTHTTASLTDHWRTLNIDALDPDSSTNFDLSTLSPPAPPTATSATASQLATQVRALLRSGDAESALRSICTDFVSSSSDDAAAAELHLQTVTEVLQSIKASEMTPLLKRVFAAEGGAECLDALMGFLYKGMAASSGLTAHTTSHSGAHTNPLIQRSRSALTPQVTGRGGGGGESSGAAMSVLLSWHEKVVEVAGLGAVGRVMTDRRRL